MSLGFAADCASADFDLTGFLSVAAGKLGNDELVLNEYDDDWSITSESVLGLQLDASLTNRLSTTVQVVGRGYSQQSGEQDISIDWAFGRYQLSSLVSIRVGRMRMPLFLYSDVLEVGYAYPWVRPPIDMYQPGVVSLDYFDGADVVVVGAVNNIDYDIQLGIGRYDTKVGGLLNIKSDRTVDFSARLTATDWQLRYSYVTLLDVDITASEFDPVIDGLEVLGQSYPDFTPVKDALRTTSDRLIYHAIGGRYDYNSWQFSSEIFRARLKGDSESEFKGWYFSTGYQWRQFFPYAVWGYSVQRYLSDMESLLVATEDDIPRGANSEVDSLRNAAQGVASLGTGSQHSFTIGLRYDVTSTSAIKFEAQRFSFGGKSRGVLSASNLASAFLRVPGVAPQNDHATLLAVSYDWVF